MSFIKTNDVSKFLKEANDENLEFIVNECAMFPRDNGYISDTDTIFVYDGTRESLKSVVNTLGIEGNALKSAEFEWIKIVLKKVEDCFDEYNLNALRGILIMKNDHAICFIKNSAKEIEQTHVSQTDSDHQSRNQQHDQQHVRYMRITYESIRNYAVEADTKQKCITSVIQSQQSKYFPSLENIRFFVFGVALGISSYVYIKSSEL